MLDAQDLPDSIAGRADVLPQASGYSCTEGVSTLPGCMSPARWTSPRQRSWGGYLHLSTVFFVSLARWSSPS